MHHNERTPIDATVPYRESLIYYLSIYLSMKGMKSIHLKVMEADHKWMMDAKGDMSWEEYFLDLARRDRERGRF